MYSERYSSPHEVKSVLKKMNSKNGGGPVLYVDPDTRKPYVLDSESNIILLGVSGAGKTRRGSISMLMSWIMSGESFIVVDPKGDLREATYCFAKKSKYEITTFNLRNTEISAGCNMFSYPAELYKSGIPSNQQIACEMVENMVCSICQHTGESDPYWIDSARSLIEASIYALFEHGTEDQINMPNIYRFISEGQEKFRDQNYLQSLCRLYPDETYSLLLKPVCSAPRDTLASILAVTYQNMSPFIKNKGINQLTSTDEFRISSLDGKKPVGIYIVTPDETSIYSSICGIFINQLTTHLIKLAHDKFSGRLPRRVNLLLEELGNIGAAIPNLDHIMSAGRSRNLRTTIVLQSLSQLNDLYGKSKATTITSNADTFIAYRTNNWETLEELSKKCGEREVNYGIKTAMEPLITPTQLGAMETGQVLCMIAGRTKFISWLPDYTEIFDLSHWTPPKKEKHERTEITNMFSIADTVKEIEIQRLKEKIVQEIEHLQAEEDDDVCLDPNKDEYTLGKVLFDLNEEEMFAHKHKINGHGNIYYAVKVVDCDAIRDLGKVQFIANRIRNKPLPSGYDKPFEVFFSDKKQADMFATFVMHEGGNAIVERRELDDVEW